MESNIGKGGISSGKIVESTFKNTGICFYTERSKK